jgi:hypothetical protein
MMTDTATAARGVNINETAIFTAKGGNKAHERKIS